MKAEYKEKLDLIQDSVYDIKNAIIEKGVQIADTEDITTFAEKIGQIQGGGGEDLPEIHDDDPLTFVQILKNFDGYISIKNGPGSQTAKKFQYNKNDEGWIDYTIGYKIPMNYADKIQFRSNDKLGVSSSYTDGYRYFVVQGVYNCGGNLASLLADDETMTLPYSCFKQTFQHTNIINAPKLPWTNISNDCYREMFYGSTIMAAPELPATTLATQCYYRMFYDCYNLTQAQDILPATTLASSCYYGMFQNCKLLTTAPKIPATTLATQCCYGMFQNCDSLTTVTELPKATTAQQNCFAYMFSSCISLTTVPLDCLPATTLASSCYSYMFNGCTNLTTAPKLPAITLSSTNVYAYMFQNCKKIKTIYCNARYTTGTTAITTTISSSWLNGLPNTTDCIFYKNKDWTGPTSRSVSTIPSNWKIATYS